MGRDMNPDDIRRINGGYLHKEAWCLMEYTSHEPKAKAWGLSRTSFDSLTQEDGMYGGMTLSGTAQPVVDNRNHLPLDKDPVPAVLAASRRLTRGYVCCCRPRITPGPRTVAGKASAFDGRYLYYTAQGQTERG